MARNTSVCRSNRKIPMADPATICTLALISRVSSSRTVALRLSTLAVLNGKKGFRSTGWSHQGCAHAGGLNRQRWCHLGPQRLLRDPLRRTRPPSLLPLLAPELDRLLSHQLPAVLKQRRLSARHHFPQSHLQQLTPAVVAPGLEVQHLAAIA